MKHNRMDFGDVTLLGLKGELGKPEAIQLEKLLDELIQEGRSKIILDLEEIRFADSYAILTLLRMDRECMALKGEIKLLRPRAVVKRFMSIGHVLELFERYETKHEAINSFKKNASQSKSTPEKRIEQAAKKQKMTIIRLIEILNRKGYFTADEFTSEYNRSAQLILEMFRKEIQS